MSVLFRDPAFSLRQAYFLLADAVCSETTQQTNTTASYRCEAVTKFLLFLDTESRWRQGSILTNFPFPLSPLRLSQTTALLPHSPRDKRAAPLGCKQRAHMLAAKNILRSTLKAVLLALFRESAVFFRQLFFISRRPLLGTNTTDKHHSLLRMSRLSRNMALPPRSPSSGDKPAAPLHCKKQTHVQDSKNLR